MSMFYDGFYTGITPENMASLTAANAVGSQNKIWLWAAIGAGVLVLFVFLRKRG